MIYRRENFARYFRNGKMETRRNRTANQARLTWQIPDTLMILSWWPGEGDYAIALAEKAHAKMRGAGPRRACTHNRSRPTSRLRNSLSLSSQINMCVASKHRGWSIVIIGIAKKSKVTWLVLKSPPCLPPSPSPPFTAQKRPLMLPHHNKRRYVSSSGVCNKRKNQKEISSVGWI